MTNYYGMNPEGMIPQVKATCRDWIAIAAQRNYNINFQELQDWIEYGGGAAHIANEIRSQLGDQAPPQKVAPFVENEIMAAVSHFGWELSQQQGNGMIYQQRNPMPQQQNQHFGQPQRNVPYGRTQMPSRAQSSLSNESVPAPTPEPAPVAVVLEPHRPQVEIESEEFSVPGATGKITHYRGNNGLPFVFLSLDVSVACGSTSDLIRFIRDIRPAGRCIVKCRYLNYHRFDVPTQHFVEVINNLKKLTVRDNWARNLTDVDMMRVYEECLTNVPAGMLNRVLGLMLGVLNQFTTSRYLQTTDTMRATIYLSDSKDIVKCLTNDESLEQFKRYPEYATRISEIMESILTNYLGAAVLDLGDEFGSVSPWLTMCGHLPLEDGSDVVASAYLSADRDPISVQRGLTEKYSIVGIPENQMIVFDTPAESSVFTRLKKAKECLPINVVTDDMEHIVVQECAGLVPVTISLLDVDYPYVKTFTHGETLDGANVITRW